MANEKNSKEETAEIILDAINSSVGQLTNEQRLKAIRAGQTTLRVRITLSELSSLVAERLTGLRGVEVVIDDMLDIDDLFDDVDGVVESIDVDTPTNVELRDYWLPMYVTKIKGATLDSDGTIEFDSVVGPPRNMHAR